MPSTATRLHLTHLLTPLLFVVIAFLALTGTAFADDGDHTPVTTETSENADAQG